jgi:hypothetical protein
MEVIPFSEDSLPEQISPEGAKIANTYLANACSLKDTSLALDLPTHEISATLEQPLVKNYVTGILREHGYAQMVKLAEKLDDLIDRKWDELEEAEIGSNKDISDLLALAHKMRMDMAKLLQADTKSGVATVNNTQINAYGKGSYGKLMQRLIEGT